jgi:hypothetical protein
MFRFTIRDVLWLTVVVALVLGWATDRSRLAKSSDDWRIRTKIVVHVMEEATYWRVSWDDRHVKFTHEKGGHQLIPISNFAD